MTAYEKITKMTQLKLSKNLVINHRMLAQYELRRVLVLNTKDSENLCQHLTRKFVQGGSAQEDRMNALVAYNELDRLGVEMTEKGNEIVLRR